MYINFIKPSLDILFALILLIILSPLFLIIFILLSFNNYGKPFFFQERLGKNGKIFKVIKFKTMSDKKNRQGVLLPDAKRLSAMGKFIRKTSLDELPQLINVIKRDMSLIGPRPFMSEYKNLYDNFQNRRHEIRPGITGWAQVNGRNNISWQQKFELDIWYVDRQTFLLDLKIIFLTFVKLIKPSDINKMGETTTVKFNGKN